MNYEIGDIKNVRQEVGGGRYRYKGEERVI